MSSNSSNFNDCPNHDFYSRYDKYTNYIIFSGWLPVYFFVGITVRLLCLRAFYKQSKTEHPYVYQVLQTFAELCEVLSRTCHSLALYWFAGDITQDGVEWKAWSTCYACMFYTAHFANGITHMVMTSSMMVTLCMLADRLYALYRPLSYRMVKARRNHILTIVVSVTIGITTSIFQIFSLNLTSVQGPDGSTFYRRVGNVEFTSTWLGRFLNHFRNGFRVLVVLLIWIGNVLLMRMYRKKRLDAQAKLGVSRDEKSKRRTEHILIVLAVSESIAISIDVLTNIVWYTAAFMLPNFTSCHEHFYAPVAYLFTYSTDISQVLILITASRSFRQMIRNALPCKVLATATSPSVQPMPS